MTSRLKADTAAWESVEHWSQCLKCAICLGCLREPHTLECGHTFCKKCLKRLATIEREEYPHTPRHKLCLLCPSCRDVFLAKPTLKGKTSLNINLNHLLELWEKECFMLLKSSVVSFRSVSTQTTENVDPKLPSLQKETHQGLSQSNHSINIDSNYLNKSTSDSTPAQNPAPTHSPNYTHISSHTHITSPTPTDSRSTTHTPLGKTSTPSTICPPTARLESKSLEAITSSSKIASPAKSLTLFTKMLPWGRTKSATKRPSSVAALSSTKSATFTKSVDTNNKARCATKVAEWPKVSDLVLPSSACPSLVQTSDKCTEVEYSHQIRPDRHYLELLLKRVLDFYEDKDLDGLDKVKTQPSARVQCQIREHHLSHGPSLSPILGPTLGPTLGHTLGHTLGPASSTAPGDNPPSSSSSDVSNSSSGSSQSEQFSSDASLSEIFGRVSIPSITIRREFTLVRVVLILLWCVYAILIVAVADASLPYIAVATFFTFLLFLG